MLQKYVMTVYKSILMNTRLFQMLKKKRLGDKCDLDLFFETSNYGQLFVKEESTGTTIKKDKDMSDKSTD